MELESGEEIVWKGRPASHVLYPILTVLFFFGILAVGLGPVGLVIGSLSVVLWILFLIVSVVRFIADKGRKYYLTNRRVISHKALLLVTLIYQMSAWSNQDWKDCVV
ncbi:MAG TPA: hypothetical protein VNA15_02735 [Candidatus Angelobacter sp.]|nr:hypothetical protein [Candidatus Angelobacter sp.]